jgi:hypothetical protein
MEEGLIALGEAIQLTDQAEQLFWLSSEAADLTVDHVGLDMIKSDQGEKNFGRTFDMRGPDPACRGGSSRWKG